IVHSPVAQARRINQQYDLSTIVIGLLDEIVQARDPVLVGVDAQSTFCFLLSPEEHRDADTWGVRLLELVDQGFAPKATIADFGMVQERPFSGSTWDLSADPDRSRALERVYV